jgi:hypothetical protein
MSTNTTTPAFAFREGSEAAAEASKGAAFDKFEFFSIEDGETAVLRFLHEYTTFKGDDGKPLYPHLAHPSFPDSTAWIVVNQHGFVPVKGAPQGWDKGWPRAMSATCRRDEAFGGAFPDCFICDSMRRGDGKPYTASGRTWSLAVLREEVRENGQIVGYKDKVKEVAEVDDKGKPTGNNVLKKDIVVVNLGWKNFFSALEGFGKVYGTILDRDYVVIRKGGGTETDYQIVALDPINAADGTRFDMRNPEHHARYANDADIPMMIAERASDEFYAKFFDTRVQWTPPSKEGESSSSAPVDQQAKPSGDASPDKMQAIADRVKGYKSGGEEGQPAQEQPAQTQVPDAQPAAAVASGPRNFD